MLCRRGSNSWRPSSLPCFSLELAHSLRLPPAGRWQILLPPRRSHLTLGVGAAEEGVSVHPRVCALHGASAAALFAVHPPVLHMRIIPCVCATRMLRFCRGSGQGWRRCGAREGSGRRCCGRGSSPIVQLMGFNYGSVTLNDGLLSPSWRKNAERMSIYMYIYMRTAWHARAEIQNVKRRHLRTQHKGQLPPPVNIYQLTASISGWAS